MGGHLEKLKPIEDSQLRQQELESLIEEHKSQIKVLLLRVKELDAEIESNTKSEQGLNAKIAEQTEKQRKIETGILKYEEQQELEAKQSKLKERLASARTDEEIHKSIVQFGKL